jgi:uncharacterized protein YcfJ
MRKLVLAATALTLTVPALPAEAHRTGYRHDHRERQVDYREHCRKRSGTTGLIVGGAGGALVGRHIDRRGDRATGTVLGAAVGALLGRHVERNEMSRRCR